MTPDGKQVLALNGGSSSIKFALFVAGDPPICDWRGVIERIGAAQSNFSAERADPPDKVSQSLHAPDHAVAAGWLMDWLERQTGGGSLLAVGHRVVHGGAGHFSPQQVDAPLLAELRELAAFAPEHLPGEIALIEAVQDRQPALLQIACFDTAFHHAMPRVAQLLPIPRRYADQGVRRYGFHGISYAFLLAELERIRGHETAQGRVILAHLGSGASMAAVHRGQSIDTSMGFTPASGLLMGRRAGDLDPGLAGYLGRVEGMSSERFNQMVNAESGLLGVSGISADIRDLLAVEATDIRAAEAVQLFCHQARKWLGAFAAVLGGLDTLVFAGGIGENAPLVRERICAGLEFLGIAIDPMRNAANHGVISADGSRVTVHVMRTDEEQMIARAVFAMLEG